MLEHKELINELEKLRAMSVTDRLRHARSRRQDQLKHYYNDVYANHPIAFRGSTSHQQITTKGLMPHQQIIRNAGWNHGRKKAVRFDVKTQLFEAVMRNDVDEVKNILLERNCDKNLKNEDGLTLVHQACIENNFEMLQMLVTQFGCDVRIADNELWTPLHTAALCGYAKLASFLIINGANTLSLNVDSNMPYDICDDDVTLNAIEQHMASNGVTQHLIESLRDERENIFLSQLSSSATASSDSHNYSLQSRGINGETPLHIAATHGYLKVMTYLVNCGVDINVIDLDQWQPVHCAAYWKKLAAIEFLIVHGADLTSRSNEGETALDICNDDQVRRWMRDLEKSSKSKPLLLPPHVHSSNQHHHQLHHRLSSHMNASSRYDSALSLSEINQLSCSSKRVSGSSREFRLRQAGHDEYVDSLLSVDQPINYNNNGNSSNKNVNNKKNYNVPVISHNQNRDTSAYANIKNRHNQYNINNNNNNNNNDSQCRNLNNNYSNYNGISTSKNCKEDAPYFKDNKFYKDDQHRGPSYSVNYKYEPLRPTESSSPKSIKTLNSNNASRQNHKSLRLLEILQQSSNKNKCKTCDEISASSVSSRNKSSPHRLSLFGHPSMTSPRSDKNRNVDKRRDSDELPSRLVSFSGKFESNRNDFQQRDIGKYNSNDNNNHRPDDLPISKSKTRRQKNLHDGPKIRPPSFSPTNGANDNYICNNFKSNGVIAPQFSRSPQHSGELKHSNRLNNQASHSAHGALIQKNIVRQRSTSLSFRKQNSKKKKVPTATLR